MDGDERPRPVCSRGLMNRLRNLLLASTGLALDQDGGCRLGDVSDQLEDFEHPRALAEDVPERMPLTDLGAKCGQFILESSLA